MPITAGLLSDSLANEGLSAGLTAPEHTGFSPGGKEPVLECILKMRKGSKVTRFFYLSPFKRLVDYIPAHLASTIGGKATLRLAFYSVDLTCFVLLIEVSTAPMKGVKEFIPHFTLKKPKEKPVSDSL